MNVTEDWKLIERHKSKRTEEKLKVGDVVFITDTDNERKDWPLGKVLKCYPRNGMGKCVQTRNGVLKRPVNRVARVHCDEMIEEGVDNEVSTSGVECHDDSFRHGDH
jgi:hypothetical protein